LGGKNKAKCLVCQKALMISRGLSLIYDLPEKA
jgi:hypothetical protein